MADLVSPTGTRATVNDALAERMLRKGWNPVKSAKAEHAPKPAPAPNAEGVPASAATQAVVKRKPGRPKKS